MDNFTLDGVLIDSSQAEEILIEVRASGVAHANSDSTSVRRPCVMGREGTGIAVERGPGDRILLTWAIPCGECFQCRRGSENLCKQKRVVLAKRFKCWGGADCGFLSG